VTVFDTTVLRAPVAAVEVAVVTLLVEPDDAIAAHGARTRMVAEVFAALRVDIELSIPCLRPNKYAARPVDATRVVGDDNPEPGAEKV
jgi:hypothetical protein